MSVEPFKIGDQTYRIVGMDAFDQLDVARLLGGAASEFATKEFMADIAGAIDQAKQGGSGDANVAVGASVVPLILPRLGAALSKMKREDFREVVSICLRTCQRQQGTQWAAVQTASGVLMFQDIEGAEMLALVTRVIVAKLGNFIPAVLGALFPANQATA